MLNKVIKNNAIKVLKNIFRLFSLDLKKVTKFDLPLYIKTYGEESVQRKKFYNISVGAYKGFGGGFQHPCWTNIDLNRTWKNDKYFPGFPEFNTSTDLAHDLLDMTDLPVDSSSAELVHSRFSVDRITDEAAQYFFNEVFRILKKGGVFRIVSTNVDLDYRAYRNNDKKYFFWLDDNISIEQMFLFHVFTQLSTVYSDPASIKVSDDEFRNIINSMTYEDALNHLASKCSLEIQENNRYDHFNWWNQQKYKQMLEKAGFTLVYRSYPEQSAALVMRNQYYFDNDHAKVMMYMEAVK